MFSVLCILAAGVLWGCMGILTRTMNEGGFLPLEVTAFRTFVTMVFMLLIMLCFKRKELKIKLKDIWIFVGTGIISVVFFNVCYFTCMTLTTLSTAAILLYTAPAFVTVMSVIIFKEKLTFRKIIGVCLAFAGCILVSGGFNAKTLGVMGILTGLGAGIGYALYSIFSRFAINRGYSSFTITTYTFLFATAGCLPFIKSAHFYSCLTADPVKIPLYVVLVFFNTIAAYICYTKGLDGLENSTASVIASIEPVVATMVGILVYKEKLTVWGIVGMTLVLASCTIVGLASTKSEKRRAHKVENME